MHKANIQTGLFADDLEKSLIKLIRAEKQKDPFKPVTVLVGSRLLGDYLSGLLLTEIAGFVNIRFITFSDLTGELNNVIAPDGTNSTVPLIAEQLAAITATVSSPINNYFGRVRKTSGFRHALNRLFRNLDLVDIDFAELFARFQPDPAGKWQALGKLYSSYKEFLEPYQHSQPELLEINDIANLFQTAFDCDSLAVYGFYDFNPAQLRLIKSLSHQINLQILMPYWSAQDGQGGVFDYAQPVFKELSEFEDSQQIAPQNNSFRSYSRHLFRYTPESKTGMESIKFEPAAELQIIRASGIAGEIAEIVGRINELALWQDTPLEKIAIILWQPDLYLEPLRNALSKAAIPFSDLIGEKLSDSASAEELRRLLNAVSTRNISHADLIDLFYGQKDEIAWGAICQKIGMAEGTLESWIEAIEWYVTSQSKGLEGGKRRHNSRQHFFNADQVESLTQYLNRLLHVNPTRTYKDSISAYVEIVLKLLDEFLPKTDDLGLVKGIIGRMPVGDISDIKVEWNIFIELVFEAIAEAPNKMGKMGVGVVIVDKMTCRGVIFDAVFLPGMVQGSIPIEPSENAVLSDVDRAAVLKNHPVDNELILPLKRRRRQEEKLLFALAVDSARSHLTLSYSKQSPTQSGTSLPSRFLIDLCRVTQGNILSSEDIELLPFFKDADANKYQSSSKQGDSMIIKTLTSKDDFLDHWIRNSYSTSTQHLAYKLIYGDIDPLFRLVHDSQIAKRNRSMLSPHDGILNTDPIASAESGNSLPVTGLEKYATCPFNYFIQSILGAQPWEEFVHDVEIPPAIIGNVVHRTLKQLYDRLYSKANPKPDSIDSELVNAAMTEILKSELRKAQSQCTAPQTVWALAFGSLKARLTNFLKEDLNQFEEFRYSTGEEKISYNFKYSVPESGELTLTGRIDRIDKTSDGKGVRIIDYKTGSANAKPEKLKGGTSLQLPLYLKAILDRDKMVELENSHAQYVKILPDGSIKRYSIDGEKLEILSESLEMTVGSINTLIHRGFFPSDAVDNACDYCTSAPACHKYSRDKVAHVTGDANLDLIRRMREET